MKRLIFTILLCGGVLPAFAQTLLHQYTFDTDATDSAGTANATLTAGATVSGGTLNLVSGGVALFSEHIVPTSGSYSITLNAQETSTLNNFVEMISQGSSGGPGFYIGHDPSYGIRAGDSWPNTGVTFPNNHLWHQYALVVDSSANTSTFYLDGAALGNLNAAISTTTGGTDTTLGSQFQGFGEFFTGSLDDLRIYNGTLNSQDLGALNESPEPSTVAILVLAGVGFVVRRVRKLKD